MKTLFYQMTLSCLLVLFSLSTGIAQTPEAFNYQAVIRDANGSIMTNQLVSLRFTIRSGSSSSNVQYQEEKTLNTNDFGLVSHSIGKGSAITGSFGAITWDSGIIWLEVEINTGSGFTSLSNEQLQSVPFALESKHAEMADDATNAVNASYALTASSATYAERLSHTWSNGTLAINGTANQPIFFRRDCLNSGVAFIKGDVYSCNKDFDWIRFVKGSSERFVVRENGYVGIGVSNPAFPLTISTQGPNTSSNGLSYAYLTKTSGAGVTSNNNSWNISIGVSDFVLSNGYVTYSDERIKNIVNRSVPENDLSLVNQLRVTNYKYIDEIGKGSRTQKGFIAQEVEKVMPEAVSIQEGYIPNVYTLTESVAQSDNGTWVITVSKTHELEMGDHVRLITSEGQQEYEVLKVEDAYTFEVSGLPADTEKLFVYGKEVDDIHTVDYDMLFTTGLGAIQELSRELDALKKENAELRSINASFQSDIDRIKTQLGMDLQGSR